jgi:hypothetical protein
MNKKIKLFTQIIFFGSIWGILEATIGHVLHFIPATIAGSIMFPIAAYVLFKGYEKTQSKFSLFYMGVVASTIKSVDLLLPQFSIFKTINPMISILLESLVVVLVVTMVVSKNPTKKYLALPIASVSWRLVFITYMGIQFLLTGNLAHYITTFGAGFEFVVISGLLSGAFGSVLLYLDKYLHFSFSKLDRYPLIASALFAIAIITTYTL